MLNGTVCNISTQSQYVEPLSSEEEMSVESVETILSPRPHCEGISLKRRLHCYDPTGVSSSCSTNNIIRR